MFKKNEKGPTYITKRNAKELAESIVRTAIQEQARELEKHLTDIDRRLRELERRRQCPDTNIAAKRVKKSQLYTTLRQRHNRFVQNVTRAPLQ